MLNDKKHFRLFLHLLLWVSLFVFVFTLTDKNTSNDNRAFPHIWLQLIEAGLIFYLNYLLLIKKFIFNKRNYVAFILVNVFVILFFRFDMAVLDFISRNDLHNHIEKVKVHNEKRNSEPFALIKSLLGLLMPTVFALLIKVAERWRGFELEKKEVETAQLQSELQNLKYQLQPHFFFNSLNNIYSLVDVSPNKAQQAIHSLSKLMQYLLHDTNNEKIDLAKELVFLEKYIELMKIRQSENVVTSYTFPNIAENQYYIAPLLLIPIIENAYKHGVSATQQSQISFDISITNNQLQFRASNTNYPKSDDLSKSGIGLENLRKRLSLLYPKKHHFTTEIKTGFFNTALIKRFAAIYKTSGVKTEFFYVTLTIDLQ